MSIFSISDIIATPVVTWIIILISKIASKKLSRNLELKKYCLPSLYIRLICTFLTCLLYSSYYGYGDTFEYYKGGEIIKSALLNGDFDVAKELIYYDYEEFSEASLRYIGEQWHFQGNSNRFVMNLSAFFSLITFGSFISISLLFTVFAFVGSWLIFLGFYESYKKNAKYLAYATLFVPSYTFWGTGIMKEPLCIFALGCIFFCGQKILIYKLFNFRHIIGILTGIFILFNVKVYILLCFLIGFIPYIIVKFEFSAKYANLKSTFKIGFAILICIISFQLGKMIFSYYQNFSSIELLLSQIDSIQSAQVINSEGGSGYNLGEIDLTPFGFVRYGLISINVTLFRPYFWEINKVVNIPASIESMLMLLFFLLTLIKTGLLKTIRIVINEPIILFCIIFVLTLSVMTGSISFNFGTLARYRIPILPFYFVALLLIRDKSANLEKIK